MVHSSEGGDISDNLRLSDDALREGDAPALPKELNDLIDAVTDIDRQQQQEALQARLAEITAGIGRLSNEQTNIEAGLMELATDKAQQERNAKKALYEAFVKKELTQDQIDTAVRLLFGKYIFDTVELLRELDDAVLIEEVLFNEYKYQAVSIDGANVGIKAYRDRKRTNLQYVPSCVVTVKTKEDEVTKEFGLTQEEVSKYLLISEEAMVDALDGQPQSGWYASSTTDILEYFLLLDAAKIIHPEIEARIESSVATKKDDLVRFFADIKNDNELSSLRIDDLLSSHQAGTIKSLYNRLVQVKPERAQQLENLIALYAAGSFSNSGRFRVNDDAMRWIRFWIKNDNPDISEPEFITLALKKYEEYVQKGFALREQANRQ